MDNRKRFQVLTYVAAEDCPRCGSNDLEVERQAPEAWVYCNQCGHGGNMANDPSGAVIKWNAEAAISKMKHKPTTVHK